MKNLICVFWSILLFCFVHVQAVSNPQSSKGFLQFSTTIFTDTISGIVFHDIGADGSRDLSDSGLANWKIDLYQASLHVDSTTSDSTGNYFFSDLSPGTYTVSEREQSGWTQTVPSSPVSYTVTISDGQTITGKDFGNTLNSIMRGTVFYDRNANGSFDPGEGGLTGWTVNAVATRPENSRTVVTQPGGVCVIDNLVTDTYVISLSVKPNWVQTFPPSTTYPLVVSTVFDSSGFDFGAATTTDTMKYRTFPPESLLVKKAVLRRRVNSKWCFEFTSNLPSTQVNGLHVVFSRTVDSITALSPFPVETRVSSREFDFTGDTIGMGQTAHICGYGSRYGMRVKRWWWTFNGLIAGPKGGSTLPVTQQFLYALPNTANLRDEVFLQYFPAGFTIGIPRPDAKTLYGWAVLPRSVVIYNSLYTNGVTHVDTPKGFVTYKGRPFIARKVTMNPVYHNNRLVASLIALKLNIAASLLAKTPPGLGELIYEEDGNSLSGLTLSQISLRADSNLTMWAGIPQSVFINLDTVISKINSAFKGPMDTVSFFSALQITGVRSVNDVPFLRPSPNISPVIEAPKTNLREEAPLEFKLYQNYPNPFNPTTAIQFELPDEAFVTLTIYNLLGQEVQTLLDHEVMSEGVQEVEFSANNLPSGIYFYRVAAQLVGEESESAGKYSVVRKMILLK